MQSVVLYAKEHLDDTYRFVRCNAIASTALVDAIFNQEKPVLILDDPFVNLDDEKTEKAKKLVKELTKRYQVLYLTCKKERRL